MNCGRQERASEKFDLVLEKASLYSKLLLCTICKPRISESEMENLLHNESGRK